MDQLQVADVGSVLTADSSGVTFTELHPANAPDVYAATELTTAVTDFRLDFELVIQGGTSSPYNDGRVVVGALTSSTGSACAALDAIGVSVYYAPHWSGGHPAKLVLFSTTAGTTTAVPQDPPSSSFVLNIGQSYYLSLRRTNDVASLYVYLDALHETELSSPLVLAATTAPLDHVVLVAQQTGTYSPPCATSGTAFGGNGGWISGRVSNPVLDYSY
jgi:hypothetical protein